MKKKNIIILIVVLICLAIFLLNITTPNMRLEKSLKNIDNTKTIMIYQYMEEYDKNTFVEEIDKNILEYNNQYYSPKKIIEYSKTIDKLINVFKKIEIYPGAIAVLTTNSNTTSGYPVYIFRLLDKENNEIAQINYKSQYFDISIKNLNDNVKLADEYKEELNEIINTFINSES